MAEGKMLLPDAIGCQRKSRGPGLGYLSTRCWSEGSLALCMATGHGEVKLVLIWKLPYCCPVLTVLGDALQTAGEEMLLTVLPSYEPCGLQ